MGELHYLYGIIRKEEADPAHFEGMKGIDGERELQCLHFGDCAAIVSIVDEEEYGEDRLAQKTKQMDWVQEKAFLHHEILMDLKERATLIPMKFGAIFHNAANLEKKIRAHEKEWNPLLQRLTGKEEWNVKFYNDPKLLKEQMVESHPSIKEKKEEISRMSKGMQYLKSKKLDQWIDDQVEQEQQSFSKGLHSLWKQLCEDDVVKKAWNRNVTGRQEDMCWNSAYLIEQANVESFLEEVSAANRKGQSSGWTIEVTGPWPAYHFSNLSKSEV